MYVKVFAEVGMNASKYRKTEAQGEIIRVSFVVEGKLTQRIGKLEPSGYLYSIIRENFTQGQF